MEHGMPYVLKKKGRYYAHNSRGYVSRVLLAELYTEEYAKQYAEQCDECQAIPISDLLTGPEEVQQYIDRMEVMRDAMQDISLMGRFVTAKLRGKDDCRQGWVIGLAPLRIRGETGEEYECEGTPAIVVNPPDRT